MDGRVKMHRKIVNRGRHTDPITLSVFIHILGLCNYETKTRKGITINPGQLLTGRKSLAEKTGLTEQNIRTALNHLKSTNEITIKSTNENSIITMVRWEEYQYNEQKPTNKSTSKLPNDQPTTNQPLTTTKEVYIYRGEEIKEILTEEEIQQNINPLKIIAKMLEMGHKIEKTKKAIGEDIKWITELTKQYIPLRENGYPGRSEAIKITDGRVDYWKNPTKGKKYPTNFKNSLRTSFSIFTKPRGQK